MTDRFIGLDLDGVLRHNNKSLGTGDIPIEFRNRKMLRKLADNFSLPNKYYITKPEDIVFIDGVLESLKLFHELDIRQYVLTNQEAIGLGIMTGLDWEKIRLEMACKIGMAGGHINIWFWCPHCFDEDCKCRKPKPGLFYQLRDLGPVPDDLSKMVFIGDNLSDMEAAHEAGCGYKIQVILDGTDEEFKQSEYADTTASSLKDAVPEILKWVFHIGI